MQSAQLYGSIRHITKVHTFKGLLICTSVYTFDAVASQGIVSTVSTPQQHLLCLLAEASCQYQMLVYTSKISASCSHGANPAILAHLDTIESGLSISVLIHYCCAPVGFVCWWKCSSILPSSASFHISTMGA